jgi:CRISPR-associated endonuclease/helicase Cas3
MLRLMSSDLVLDELDDYDLADLPALTRLMHWAGLLGARVVLSSATLPPALVQGMFMAYRAGRRHYRRNRGQVRVAEDAPIDVPCLWTDEFGAQPQSCASDEDFASAHARFVERRMAQLQTAVPLRIAELLPVAIDGRLSEARRQAAFAAEVRQAILRLHAAHAEADPTTGKRASFGIVRMANIEPIFAVARALIESAMPADTRLHLCVYHARFPLVQRSAIEAMLDATFNRRDPQAAWQQPAVHQALHAHAEPDHLFVVLASPVCEVGRDWDADWALAEPSSMRSLIQLAGRVQRHRRKPPQAPNVLVFDTNLKGIPQGSASEAVFAGPGFEKGNAEDESFLLRSHRLSQLLAESEYKHLTAIPRVRPRSNDALQPRERWVDLEHARIRATMLPAPSAPAPTSSRGRNTRSPLEAPASWQYPQAALIGVLPQQQPFRADASPKVTLAWLPDEDEDSGLKSHRVVDVRGGKRGEQLYVRESLHPEPLAPAAGVSRWGAFDLLALVVDLAEAQDVPLDRAARKFTAVAAPHNGHGWRWHPWLGVAKQR